ncbi:TolC family protein [Stieleria sp. JC731]|nr:TolC family protein [Stieleria sp. JC731]MCC9601929.1 TolC family protein [Stieleria sp. JC731]
MPCSQRPIVSAELQTRVGTSLGSNCGLSNGAIPPGLDLSDGLTEDEAVAIALWNNAALGELLARLGISRAQLYEAGLFSDPQLVLLLPVGPKQLEFTAYQAIDEIWLRPIRRRAAELDLCQLAKQMIQNGLNTARDVRLAHANLVLAQRQMALSEESLSLRDSIQGLANQRLDAGDISELEANTTRIDSLTAKAMAASAVHDVVLAQEQLRTLLGVDLPNDQILAVGESDELIQSTDKEAMVQLALSMRPDLRAVEIRKAAACRRLELAKKQFMRLEGGYDANGSGKNGFESGPAFRMTLPIFNRNRGQVAIAEAAVEQVDRQYAALRDQIELEVRTAMTQLDQANEQVKLFDQEVLPALREAQELSRRNYENGGVPYFLVLQTTTQFVDAQQRRALAMASSSRAEAELERAVGQRLPRLNVRPDEGDGEIAQFADLIHREASGF